MIAPSAEQTRERAEKLRDWLLDREPDSADNHTGRVLRDLLDLLASQDRALGELRDQAQLYIDQREMTLAAKRDAEAQLTAAQGEIERLRYNYDFLGATLKEEIHVREQAEAERETMRKVLTRVLVLLRHPDEQRALLQAERVVAEALSTPARPTEEP